MCLATVLAMERRGIDYLRGVKWTAGITVGMVLAVGLTPVKEEGEWKIGLASDMPTFGCTLPLPACACWPPGC